MCMTNRMIDNRCKKLADLEGQIKALQAQADAIKNEIKADMEADSLEEIDTGKYKVRYKLVESVRLDNKALKADLPDVYSRYSKVSQCRRLQSPEAAERHTEPQRRLKKAVSDFTTGGQEMKKTKFYIYEFFGEKKPQARQVNGYFEYIDGVALGLHKPENDCVWAVTELSTGLKITDGQTRQKALDNVLEFLPQVRTEINKDRFKKVKEIIQAAYKAG